MAREWWHGSAGDYHYEILGYEYKNGHRVEGVPPTWLLTTNEVVGLFVHTWPPKDPEKGHYWWTYFYGREPDIPQWLNNIRISAKNSPRIELSFDLTEGEEFEDAGE